jgi:hypothetical protein
MADEEPGLLGNLPRSRPGTRSGKRDSSGSQPAPKREQAAKPGRGGRATAKKSTGSVKSKAPAKKEPTKEKAAGQKAPRNAPSRPPAPSAKGKSVPVGVAEDKPQSSASRGPLHQAAKVAGTGLRVAEGVTREVLRRLPRP